MAAGTLLYRLGRQPDPLAWPPYQFVGDGRFDDPARRFRVLYAAKHRRACFVEVLAPFRPSLSVLAAERMVLNAPDPPDEHAIPSGWLHTRAIIQLRLAAGQTWLDLRRLRTRQMLRKEFVTLLLDLGFVDLDLSTVCISGSFRGSK